MRNISTILYLLIATLVLSQLALAQTSTEPNPTRAQISSTTAEHNALDCKGEVRGTTVTVQVWIIGGPQERPKGQILTIGLYGSSATPIGNRLLITEPSKDVEIGESPAVVRFQVECVGETMPGDISLAANIDKTPSDFKVLSPDPPEQGRVRIHVK